MIENCIIVGIGSQDLVIMGSANVDDYDFMHNKSYIYIRPDLNEFISYWNKCGQWTNITPYSYTPELLNFLNAAFSVLNEDEKRAAIVDEINRRDEAAKSANAKPEEDYTIPTAPKVKEESAPEDEKVTIPTAPKVDESVSAPAVAPITVTNHPDGYISAEVNATPEEKANGLDYHIYISTNNSGDEAKIKERLEKQVAEKRDSIVGKSARKKSKIPMKHNNDYRTAYRDFADLWDRDIIDEIDSMSRMFNRYFGRRW